VWGRLRLQVDSAGVLGGERVLLAIFGVWADLRQHRAIGGVVLGQELCD